ncbi:MAG: DNA repair protein RadA [Balneolales bacterium]|nr:DNA repair protein RadA [Balneolales bacterium]
MSVVRASDLVKTNFPGFYIPGFEKIIGRAQSNTSVFIWGVKFSGKSTVSIMLAKGLSERRGTVLYCSSEEGAGATMKDKIERMRAGVKDLLVGDYLGLHHLKQDVIKHKAKVLVLDSAHMAHLREKEQIDLYEWCKQEDIFFIVVNHATKDGKFKGSSMLAHMVDVELRVADGVVYVEKNRLPHDAQEMPINFDQRKSKTSDRKKQASPRQNPVPVPFKIPLSDIAKRHKIRGIKRLNDMVDFAHSCTVDRNPVSFRYKRQNKKSYLEMLQSGKVIHTHCADTFVSAWKKMSTETGSTVIEIINQAHARKVLGAQEYRRQEKEYAKKGDKTVSKPKTVKASTPATKTKPATQSRPTVKVEDARKAEIKDGSVLRSSKTKSGSEIDLIYTGGNYQIRQDGKPIFEHINGDKANDRFNTLKDAAPKRTVKPRKIRPKSKQKETFDSRMDRLETLLSQAIA